MKFRRECVDLYSHHYGIWGTKARHNLAGKHVRLSDSLFRHWISNRNAYIYFARDSEKLIGYAVILQMDVPSYGVVTWVTQLVVHQKYRNQGVAKQILLSVWGFSDHKVWGIVTANPYAIRALEKVTRCRVVPSRIMQDEKILREFSYKNISYIDESTELEINNHTSRVNTKFFVDHSEVPHQIKDVTTQTTAWLLGELEEGWEWFAFTFQDQETIALQPKELQQFLDTSDNIVKTAYARMHLKPEHQKWMQHTEAEINYILKNIEISPSARVYDLGCGVGWHSVALSKRGFDVTGIDYIDRHIEESQKNAEEAIVGKCAFVQEDCRYYTNEEKAELVLCLYDVIGSFSDIDSNIEILQRSYDLLRPGGFFVLSVMNYELTLSQAKHCFIFADEPNKLFSIQPSRIMETTGNVFHPEYYLVDVSEHVVYRKEQFPLRQGNLPTELLVRGRKFTRDEISALCRSVGFKIKQAKFVNAASWEESYMATDDKAKEILLICCK